jgi:predicted ATPase
MKLLSYETKAASSTDLYFSTIKFSNLNLIVGGSATGKTRLLNTIFNGATMAVLNNVFYRGCWNMTCEHEGQIYRWEIETTGGNEGEDARVLNELIAKKHENGNEEILLSRDENQFTFKGNKLPKIAHSESGVSLLREEEEVKPLYEGFKLIRRRSFSGSELEQASGYIKIPQSFINKIKKSRNFEELFSSNLNLNGTLYILSQYFKDMFNFLTKEFQNVFPFVNQCEVLNADHFGFNFPGIVPVFAIKEKHSDHWIPLNEMSSGMKKVLLILTDICIMPTKGGIYIVDEYENSLGVNAINFFPNILFDTDNPTQFIITSHHPYIIGNISPENWIVLHRKGTQVKIRQGEEFAKRFGKSKQLAFTQLINDSFYIEGVE